jgi:hypothetical protein
MNIVEINQQARLRGASLNDNVYCFVHARKLQTSFVTARELQGTYATIFRLLQSMNLITLLDNFYAPYKQCSSLYGTGFAVSSQVSS